MKRNKGITLIALVITIIILIILAAVSINLVIGENGILKRTQSSALKYTVSEIQDNLEMVKGTVAMNGKRIDLENYLEELQNKYSDAEVNRLNEDQAEIIMHGKYKFLATDEKNGNVKIVYEGNESELKLSENGATIKYEKNRTFTITENTSGGTLSVESENNELVTATLNGNEVKVNVVGRVEETTQVKITVKSEANARFAERKATYTVTIPAKDEVAPSATITVDTSVTSETIPINVQVLVAQSDNDSLKISSCKYALNTTSTNLGTNVASYTGGFTTANETLNLPLSNTGTYYLHVLSVDEEDNKQETIQAIVIGTHTHGNECYDHVHSEVGGTCYSKHTHTSSCYCNGTIIYNRWDSGSGVIQITKKCSRCNTIYARWQNANGYVDDGYWSALEKYNNGKTEGKCTKLMNCSKTYDFTCTIEPTLLCEKLTYVVSVD